MHARITPISFWLLAVPAVVLAAGEPAKPTAEPLSHYQAMIDRSPFALATEAAPPPPAAENAGFTKDLVLTGAVRLKKSEYITIASKDQTQRFSLHTGETYNGISVVSIAWSDAVGKTRATLKRGTEYGTITFDEAAARAGAVAPVPSAIGIATADGLQQGVPGGQGNVQPPLPPGNVPPNANQPGSAPGTSPANAIIRRGRPIRVSPLSN